VDPDGLAKWEWSCYGNCAGGGYWNTGIGSMNPNEISSSFEISDGKSDGRMPPAAPRDQNLDEVVVIGKRAFNWTNVSNDWWPGYGIGSCIYGSLSGSGCGVSGWLWAGIGAFPGGKYLQSGKAIVKAANSATGTAKVFSKAKQALVDMAKADKRRGMSSADMQAYKDLNRGLPDPFPSKQVRGPEAHPSGAPSSQVPHGHVGPVNHIPIVDP
jgi:hypothetical protein